MDLEHQDRHDSATEDIRKRTASEASQNKEVSEFQTQGSVLGETDMNVLNI